MTLESTANKRRGNDTPEERDALRIKPIAPDHASLTVAIPIYFKLFWTPILGIEVATLYELLKVSIERVGAVPPPPTKSDLADILGLDDVQDLRPLMQTLKQFDLLKNGGDCALLVIPPPLIGARLAHELLPERLQRLHERFLASIGVELPPAMSGMVQQPLIEEVAVQPLPEVSRKRRVPPEAGKLVEFFLRSLGETHGAPDGVFVTRNRAREITIASSMLRHYEYNECLQIIKRYLNDPARARTCTTLAQILRQADFFLNVIQGKAIDRPSRRQQHSRLIVPEGDIENLGDIERW